MRTDRMTTPLTDEEFEGLKEYYKDNEKVADIHALIATVESLKEGRNLEDGQIISYKGAMEIAVSKYRELKQEIEILIGELKEARQLNDNSL